MILTQESYRIFFQEELEHRLKLNPRYSQRAFARDLGLSPGELSEIIRGKRRLSLKAAFKIGKALGFSNAEISHLASLAGQPGASELASASSERRELSLDLFRVVCDWYCFALLNLIECEGFRWNEKWIARRLGISPLQARMAVSRLERVGLIERKKSGFAVCRDYVISPEGIPSEAVRQYHRQILKKAADAIDLQKVSEREFSGISFAVDPSEVPSLKKEIAAFLDDLAAKYSKRRKKKEVYQCEVALFRLTKALEREK